MTTSLSHFKPFRFLRADFSSVPPPYMDYVDHVDVVDYMAFLDYGDYADSALSLDDG